MVILWKFQNLNEVIMKTTVYIVITASIFLLGFSSAKIIDGSFLEDKTMTQVGIVVDDIEKAAKAWTEFLGLDEIPRINVAEGHDSRPTVFRGDPSNASARLAFFLLDNITIELIEPLEGSSTWREFLEKNGPGIHHIAFNVEKMKHSVQLFGKAGIHEVQHGGWGTGEYAYMDASGSLGLIIELLEHYKD
jgi:catechol 2,3-dioxygenase-like lactoylglutathione lyase family enzyme